MLPVKHCWQRLYLPCFLTISKKLERVADSNVATRCDRGIETALIASFVAHAFEILVEKPIVVLLAWNCVRREKPAHSANAKVRTRTKRFSGNARNRDVFSRVAGRYGVTFCAQGIDGVC